MRSHLLSRACRFLIYILLPLTCGILHAQGNVGIGTTTPQALLDIQGTGDSELLRLSTGKPWVFKESPSYSWPDGLALQATTNGSFFEMLSHLGTRMVTILDLDSSTLIQLLTHPANYGRVSIGPLPHQGKLSVRNQADTGPAIYGESTITSGLQYGVHGKSNNDAAGVRGENTGGGTGVVGTSIGLYGTGVFGSCSHASGTTTGIQGQVASTNGTGVYGYAYAVTGSTRGVHGKTSSPDGIGVYGDGATGVSGKSSNTAGRGVYGLANASTGSTRGVLGQALSHNGVGVYGEALGGDNGKALYGYANGLYGKGLHVVATGTHSSVNAILADANNGSAYAGYFIGRVQVAGTLSKSSGSFKIDHPLDPEGKYLFHSFVESPDMMNIYNGNVTTDADGRAVVSLPAYFDALNMDFRYQLTVIGEFAQAIIAEKIHDNQFAIRTDKPNIEVSWMVTGIRKDPWAQAHRIEPEVDKEPENKGRYLTPEVYGMPETSRINYSETVNNEQ